MDAEVDKRGKIEYFESSLDKKYHASYTIPCLFILSFLGEWSEGRWHGQGRASFNNGDFYDGQYSYDQRHGKGTYSWVDGRVYSGGFVADRRQGHGVYTWPDGARYDGYFKDGQHDGQGTYKVCTSTG
jgi:hypothetical protein